MRMSLGVESHSIDFPRFASRAQGLKRYRNTLFDSNRDCRLPVDHSMLSKENAFTRSARCNSSHSIPLVFTSTPRFISLVLSPWSLRVNYRCIEGLNSSANDCGNLSQEMICDGTPFDNDIRAVFWLAHSPSSWSCFGFLFHLPSCQGNSFGSQGFS